MKRLIIVYNTRSAGYERVRAEVIEKSRELKGWTIGKYIIKQVPVEQNAKNLAKILQDGDLVVVAGGDGTASTAVHGIMSSDKKVVFGVLGYGNFNDLAHTLGAKNLQEIIDAAERKQIAQMWPLAVSLNDQFWRYAACYMTVGLLADSTSVFEQKSTREKMPQQSSRRLMFSLWSLVKWYFCTRKKKIFLPQVSLNGRPCPYSMTDYLAINSKRVANIMKANDCYLSQDVFWRAMFNMKNFGTMAMMMFQSVFKCVPGEKVTSDILEFERPASVSIQIEGEYHHFENIERIMVRKAKKSLTVVKLH